MLCTHSSWFDVSDDGSFHHIRQTSRLRSLIASLPQPRFQTPSLILVHESLERKYFPASERSGVYLRLDKSTASGEHPLFFANLQSLQPPLASRRDRSEYRCCSVAQEASFDNTINALPRVLLPFIDVLCFLCVTHHDLRDIETQIRLWCRVQNAVHADLAVPEIAVLLADDYHLTAQEVQRQVVRKLKCLGAPRGTRLSVVKIGQSSLTKDGLQPIRDRIDVAVARSRGNKAKRGLTFSACNLQELLEHAFMLQKVSHRFRYIEAARTHNPVPTDLVRHLNNFLSVLPEDCDDSFVAESIASALLLDHLTDKMHAFHVNDVFTVLYRGACHALSSVCSFPVVDMVLHYMEQLYPTCDSPGQAIVETHRSVMKKYRKIWQTVKASHSTCFVCLRRRPEYKLTCDHMLCLYCVREFGTQRHENAYRYVVSQCYLCQADSQLVVLDRPPTAGIGMLCLDGGGARGIVQPTILELLEEEMGLLIPIQECFQMVAGVSAGALNVIGLFLKGWTPFSCAEKYVAMAGSIFRRKLVHYFPVISMLLSILDNALYPAAAIEKTIEDVYGKAAGMLDPSYATSIGARVLLPVAAMPEPSLLLFTNYNGVGNPDARMGYRVYEQADDVSITDVARTCTAAPVFFEPKYIAQLRGRFQDPGLVENNVSTLMPAELDAYYGPSRKCQFILNIGTGLRRPRPARPHDGWLLGPLIDMCKESALGRIASAYSYLLNGSASWGKHVRSIDKASTFWSKCVRLDLEMEEEVPRLDDIRAMAELRERVRRDPALMEAVRKMARRLIASLFYFELEAVPQQRGCIFSGTGRIWCLRKKGDAALTRLVDKIIASRTTFVINDRTVDVNLFRDSVWDCTGNLALPVAFQLLTCDLSISLRWPDGSEYPISGAPYTLLGLVRAQGLDCSFGLPSVKRQTLVKRMPFRQPTPVRSRKRPRRVASEKACKRRKLMR